MPSSNIFNYGAILWLILFLLTGYEVTSQVTCKNDVVLYLEPDGTRTLEVSDFTDDTCLGCVVDVIGDQYVDQIDCSAAGKIIAVAIIDPGGSTIVCNARILDITSPVFISCADRVVGCHLDVMTDHIDSFGIVAVDACGIDTIFPIICGGEVGDCLTSTKILKIQWQAIDSLGNVGSCMQFLTYEKRSLADVTLPARDTIYCDDVAVVPIIPKVDDSIAIDNLCGLLVGTHDDDTISFCGAELEIRRTWTVLDACSLESQDFVQVITVLDSVGPIVSCPVNDTLYIDSLSCEIEYQFPELMVTYNCAPEDTLAHVVFDYQGGLYAPGDIVTLGHGSDTVLLIVTDNCWKLDTCRYFLEVFDTFPPDLLSCLEDTIVDQDPNLKFANSCTELDARFGVAPIFISNCCPLLSIECELINAIDPVQDTGFILRKYWVRDTCGNVSDTCTQEIRSTVVVQNVRGEQANLESSESENWRIFGSRSGIRPVNIGSSEDSFVAVWPNPFKDQSELRIVVPDDYATSVMRIYDNRGSLVFVRKYREQAGVSLEVFDGVESGTLASGIYYLSIETDIGKKQVIKLLKM